MIKRRTKTFSFILSGLMPVALVVWLGCAKRESTEENTSLRAQRLIDEHRDNEAIALMEAMVKSHPNEPKYRVLLASAYAHKAGFNVQGIVPAYQRAQEFSRTMQLEIKMRASEDVDAYMFAYANIFRQFTSASSFFSSVPRLDKIQAIYMAHAISLLGDLGENLRPEDALYRAVLEFIYLKHQISKVAGSDLYAEYQEEACYETIKRVNREISGLGNLLGQIYGDVAKAMPSQAKEMQRLSELTKEMTEQIAKAVNSSKYLSEALRVYANDATVGQGFGKLIECLEATPVN